MKGRYNPHFSPFKAAFLSPASTADRLQSVTDSAGSSVEVPACLNLQAQFFLAFKYQITTNKKYS